MSTPAVLESKMTPRLALELAAQLRPPADVLSTHGISTADFGIIKKHPHFQRLYREAAEFWNSKDNSADRVKAVSTMMVEESLVTLFTMTHDPELHPSARLDALKVLTKLSGTDQAGALQAAMANHAGKDGPRFQIAINLQPVGDIPAGKFVIDAEVEDAEDAQLVAETQAQDG